MSDIEVKVLNRGEFREWNDLVERSVQGTIFLRTDWLSVSSQAQNKSLKLFGFFKGEDLIAGCPVFFYRDRKVFRAASSSATMMPYGGVILANSSGCSIRRQAENYNSVVEALCRSLYAERCHSLRITLSPDLIDIRPFVWAGWAGRVRYTYYLDLGGDFERSISKSARQSIKKAREGGFEVVSCKDPDLFYQLFAEMFREQGLKSPVNKSFFQAVVGLIDSKRIGDMRVAKAPTDEAAAVSIVLWDEHRAYAWAYASKPSFKKWEPHALVLDSTFRSLCERGIKEVNLMGGNTPRFTNYFLKYHPRLVPYYSAEKKTASFRLVEHLIGKLKPE